MCCRLPLIALAVVLAIPAISQENASSVPAHAATTTAAQPSSALAIMLESLKKADNDLDLRKNYTYQEREVSRELDDKGNVKKTEIHTYDVVMVGGKHHSKLIAKNDQPLSEKDAAKEEERLRKQ